MEKPQYNTDIVRGFVNWSILWGLVAVLVGVIVSLQMVNPDLNFTPISPSVDCVRFIPMPAFMVGESVLSLQPSIILLNDSAKSASGAINWRSSTFGFSMSPSSRLR